MTPLGIDLFKTLEALNRQRVKSLKNCIQNFMLIQAYNVVIIFICWAILRNFTDMPANSSFPAMHIPCINPKIYTIKEILIGLCMCLLNSSFSFPSFVISFSPFLVKILMFIFYSWLLLSFNGAFAALHSVNTAPRKHRSENSCYNFTLYCRPNQMAVITNGCKCQST
jgi:hypothetical protein